MVSAVHFFVPELMVAASIGLMQKSSSNMKCNKKSVTLYISKGFLGTQQPTPSPSHIYVETHRYK